MRQGLIGRIPRFILMWGIKRALPTWLQVQEAIYEHERKRTRNRFIVGLLTTLPELS